ncbi:MAG: PAC2 family protein [Candidatus Micrarchaeota archaeon]|nr:PAC2 family protein [Candidatus Micrarchaeota archaeon]
MAVKFNILAKPKLRNPVLVEGFPGLGLVGTIAASYLIEKLKMEPLGYITSDQFPPLAAVHNRQPLYPARMYYSTKYNLIVFVSEFVIPISVVNELAEKIYEFARKNKISKIISLGGIPIKGEQDEVYAISSLPSLIPALEKIPSVKIIKEGATTGVTGMLLAKGAVENYPVISLLAESHEGYMDPKAAAMVLDVLRTLLRFELDTSTLEDEAKVIDSKVKEALSKAKSAHSEYKKVQDEASLGQMYG